MLRNTRLLLAVVIVLLHVISNATWGQVTTTGSVLNDPPVGGGNAFTTEVKVGDANDNVDSILGTLRIEGDTDLGRERLIIGDDAGYIGDVVVSGSGTTLDLDSNSSSNPALQIGNDGTGYMTIDSQAVVVVSNLSGNVVVGFDSGSAGFLNVDGLLTRLEVGEDLVVGSLGYGELRMTNGALMNTLDASGSTARIGDLSGGVGLVELDGARTLWQLPRTVTVGNGGVGTLRITNGATASGVITINDVTVGTLGVVELAGGGRLLSSGVTVNGRLTGDGLVTGAVTVAASGEIGATAGQTLQLTAAVTNAGVVNVSGDDSARAEIRFADTVTNSAGGALPGRIAIADGTVRFAVPLTNQGTLASTSGVTDFHGSITNAATGTIAINGGSHATFYDAVDASSGTLNIAEGSTALFLSDISIATGSQLAVRLDSSAQSLGFSTPLQTNGAAALDGDLALSVVLGADLEAYKPIPILDAAGGVSGTFGTVDSVIGQAGIAAGQGLAVTYAGDTVDVTPALLGDANLDQSVDVLLDASTLIENLGTTSGATWTTGDFNGDGAVDVLGDASALVENLGSTFGSGARISAAAVPEPGGLAMLTLLGCLFTTRRCRT